MSSAPTLMTPHTTEGGVGCTSRLTLAMHSVIHLDDVTCHAPLKAALDAQASARMAAAAAAATATTRANTMGAAFAGTVLFPLYQPTLLSNQ
jgi:hypothetical protein